MAKMVLSEHWAKHCPLLFSQWLKIEYLQTALFSSKGSVLIPIFRTNAAEHASATAKQIYTG